MKDKPFALLGVNSDADREKLKQTLAVEEINWRSWWDGGSVTGPIQTQWQVLRRPTLVVLDTKGVIRFKDIEIDDLDRAVESLLAESTAEAGQIR